MRSPERIAPYPASAVRCARLFSAFLGGYHADVDDELLESVAESFERHYLPLHRRVWEDRVRINGAETTEERMRIFRRDWMDRRSSYGLLLALLHRPPDASGAAGDAPWTTPRPRILRRIRTFAPDAPLHLVT